MEVYFFFEENHKRAQTNGIRFRCKENSFVFFSSNKLFFHFLVPTLGTREIIRLWIEWNRSWLIRTWFHWFQRTSNDCSESITLSLLRHISWHIPLCHSKVSCSCFFAYKTYTSIDTSFYRQIRAIKNVNECDYKTKSRIALLCNAQFRFNKVTVPKLSAFKPTLSSQLALNRNGAAIHCTTHINAFQCKYQI